MRNVKKILDCCSKPCVVHVLCLMPLLAFYFLLNWNGQRTRVFKIGLFVINCLHFTVLQEQTFIHIQVCQKRLKQWKRRLFSWQHWAWHFFCTPHATPTLQSSLSYWTWRYETLRMRLKREGENENPAGLLGFVDEDEAGVVMEKGWARLNIYLFLITLISYQMHKWGEYQSLSGMNTQGLSLSIRISLSCLADYGWPNFGATNLIEGKQFLLTSCIQLLFIFYLFLYFLYSYSYLFIYLFIHVFLFIFLFIYVFLL